MKRRESKVKTLGADKKKNKEEEKKSNVVVKAGANALKKGFGKLNGKFKVMM